MIDTSTGLKGDKTPIVIVIPGLTSDSTAAVSFYLFLLIFLLILCCLN